mmetsp:Transcript_14717/g.33371  ORF Transcript_14717/g.33371 Transcript_14717/m.33371 type:complete len:108 (-) Transcript_14717:576-899(-)
MHLIYGVEDSISLCLAASELGSYALSVNVADGLAHKLSHPKHPWLAGVEIVTSLMPFSGFPPRNELRDQAQAEESVMEERVSKARTLQQYTVAAVAKASAIPSLFAK